MTAKIKKIAMREVPSSGFNFVADHLTLLVDPSLYKLMYAFMRIILRVPAAGVIYEKRRRWPGARSDSSMTFAVATGDVAKEKDIKIARTMIAVVQPTEPAGQSSHVRTMLADHDACAHWQHVALRTPDLFGFHEHALAHGVNFITPLMQDKDEDLVQVFSGELFSSRSRPSGIFFEFVQRDVTPQLLSRLKKLDRQSFFRDKTFLGLYGEKELEYQRGKVTPLWDHELMERLQALWQSKELWEITDRNLREAADAMQEYARSKRRKPVAT